ncbi:MAG TPA: helix-turn-helix transcriptional regulator [Candidatus Paceibacterota bacterium]|nr:helix-turn-helix transcriptional regulator [Candidatus Paceibacterota bacterium]
MYRRTHNYIRAYRKRAGLSQDELALLLGCRSGTKVSRYERHARTPTLETALACQAIFGVPVHELFPGMYREVEQVTHARAQTLARQLRSTPGTPLPERKAQLLDMMGAPRDVIAHPRNYEAYTR